MAQVVVTISGRTYRMNCEDGQELHLQRLAQEVDERMSGLKGSFGEIGDQRLAVMAALTISDELDSARRRIDELEADAVSVRADRERADADARAQTAELEAALDGAADRIERLADMLNTVKA